MELSSNIYKLFINVYKMEDQYEYQDFGCVSVFVPKIKIDYSLIPLKQIDKNYYESQVSKEKENIGDYKISNGSFIRKRKTKNSRTIEIIFSASSFEEAEKIGLEICSKKIKFFPFLMKRKLKKRIAVLKAR